jgi:hypothetical protein
MSNPTLLEALEDEDITNIGLVEKTKETEAAAKMVDKVMAKKKAEGALNNHYVLFAFKFPELNKASVLPIQYRNEETNTNLVSALLKALPSFKLPPSKFLYSTVDVIPTGILFNCNKMEYNDVEKVLKMFSSQITIGKVSMRYQKRDENGKMYEPKTSSNVVNFRILPYARTGEDYVFSAQIDKPMLKYEVAGAIAGYILDAAPLALVTKTFNIWGEPAFRKESSQRDAYYLADDGDTPLASANKHRYTAFYKEPPKVPIPPFYSVQDTSGKVVGTWKISTRCFDLEKYHVCDTCRADLSDFDFEHDEHVCLDAGNFIPSTRKTVERQKMRAKKKKVSLREAIAMGGVVQSNGAHKRHMDNSPIKPPSKKHAEATTSSDQGKSLDQDFDQEVDEMLLDNPSSEQEQDTLI